MDQAQKELIHGIHLMKEADRALFKCLAMFSIETWDVFIPQCFHDCRKFIQEQRDDKLDILKEYTDKE